MRNALSLIVAFLVVFLFVTFVTYGQELPPERATDWTLAGLKEELPEPTVIVDFVEEGGVGDGVFSNSTVMIDILAENEGEMLQINFPEGDFFFDQTIHLPGNVILNGSGADSTLLKFDFGGANWSLINTAGSLSGESSPVVAAISKDDNGCQVADVDLFEVGDWVKIVEDDEDLVVSDWALGQTGQFLKVAEITGDELIFESPFRRDYSLENAPEIYLANMKENVAIQHLKVERVDPTDGQARGIRFYYAANCIVKCVESFKCDFGHVVIEASSNCVVSGSYFHHSHDYGGGGNGYGVVCQIASGECLIIDNNFEHLRHAMLLQAGSNGNVFAYNYSRDQYWEEPGFPDNAGGDLVLHGNYPYSNLFEGNIVLSITVDQSHGINGPYNTFFRNRAVLYGILNDADSPSQNYIGNEITNDGFLLGLYGLAGDDHFEYGNNHRGDTKPAGTDDLTEASLYLDETPFYYTSYSSWPPIGYPNEMNSYDNEAKNNYFMDYEIQCENLYEDLNVVEIETFSEISIYPNPTTGTLTFVLPDMNETCQVNFYNLSGECVQRSVIQGSFSELSCTELPAGTYLVQIITAAGEVSTSRVVKL